MPKNQKAKHLSSSSQLSMMKTLLTYSLMLNGQLEEYLSSLEEMKKDLKADELKMNTNIPTMLDSEEMKKNEVMEANDSMVINNSEAMLDSYLSLDMSWMDSDSFDMSWIDSYCHHDLNMNDTYNLNFQHGVEV
ncbi:hypothetical protein Tco_0345496 [Tanacetum coccineum]